MTSLGSDLVLVQDYCSSQYKSTVDIIDGKPLYGQRMDPIVTHGAESDAMKQLEKLQEHKLNTNSREVNATQRREGTEIKTLKLK